MPFCSVITCIYCEEGEGAQPAEGITFHPFPANEEVRDKWILMTGRELGWVPRANDFICSRHFRDNDYFIKRSGNRYLKTFAIPCEHIYYRHLFLDEVVPLPIEEANEAVKVEYLDEAEAGPSGLQSAVNLPEQPPDIELEPEPGFSIPEEDVQPGPSRAFSPAVVPNVRPAHEADSTSMATIYDNEECRPWDDFRPDLYFGCRLPASIFDDPNTEEAGSSGFDDRYQLEVSSAMNPYPPVALGLPIEPEPIPPAPKRTEPMPAPAPGPRVDRRKQKDTKKLENIKTILARRHSSKKRTDQPRPSRRQSRTETPTGRSRGMSSSSDD